MPSMITLMQKHVAVPDCDWNVFSQLLPSDLSSGCPWQQVKVTQAIAFCAKWGAKQLWGCEVPKPTFFSRSRDKENTAKKVFLQQLHDQLGPLGLQLWSLAGMPSSTAGSLLFVSPIHSARLKAGTSCRSEWTCCGGSCPPSCASEYLQKVRDVTAASFSLRCSLLGKRPRRPYPFNPTHGISHPERQKEPIAQHKVREETKQEKQDSKMKESKLNQPDHSLPLQRSVELDEVTWLGYMYCLAMSSEITSVMLGPGDRSSSWPCQWLCWGVPYTDLWFFGSFVCTLGRSV